MYEWDEAAVSCEVIREDFTEKRHSSRELEEEKATQASTDSVPSRKMASTCLKQVHTWPVQETAMRSVNQAGGPEGEMVEMTTASGG